MKTFIVSSHAGIYRAEAFDGFRVGFLSRDRYALLGVRRDDSDLALAELDGPCFSNPGVQLSLIGALTTAIIETQNSGGGNVFPKHIALDFKGEAVATPTQAVLDEVAAERRRQDDKFGQQDIPLVDTVLTNREGGCSAADMAEHYELPSATRARFKCDQAHERGCCTWAHILAEEFAEFIEAATVTACNPKGIDPDAVRTELIQLAAVAVAGVERIDRQRVAEVEGLA